MEVTRNERDEKTLMKRNKEKDNKGTGSERQVMVIDVAFIF